jgi:hypothetical protein
MRGALPLQAFDELLADIGATKHRRPASNHHLIDFQLSWSPDHFGFRRDWLGSAGAHPHAGAQKFLGINGFAVYTGLVVEMRAGRSAGRTNGADHLADLDWIANFDTNF